MLWSAALAMGAVLGILAARFGVGWAVTLVVPAGVVLLGFLISRVGTPAAALTLWLVISLGILAGRLLPAVVGLPVAESSDSAPVPQLDGSRPATCSGLELGLTRSQVEARVGRGRPTWCEPAPGFLRVLYAEPIEVTFDSSGHAARICGRDLTQDGRILVQLGSPKTRLSHLLATPGEEPPTLLVTTPSAVYRFTCNEGRVIGLGVERPGLPEAVRCPPTDCYVDGVSIGMTARPEAGELPGPDGWVRLSSGPLALRDGDRVVAVLGKSLELRNPNRKRGRSWRTGQSAPHWRIYNLPSGPVMRLKMSNQVVIAVVDPEGRISALGCSAPDYQLQLEKAIDHLRGAP